MDYAGWDEGMLVVAARAGDLKAFDVLARRYRPAAVALASQTLPAETAEDAAQDSLLAAFKSLPSLEDAERFGAWLGAIVRHRSRRLGRERSRAPLALDEVIVAYAPAIVSRLQEDESAKRIRCAISKLPEDIRVAAALRFLQEWTAPEIAGFLSLPLTTVKWRLHTARMLLRDRLAFLEEIDE